MSQELSNTEKLNASIRLSELHIEQQTRFALASDQRAITFCGFMLVLLTFVLGFQVDVLSESTRIAAAFLFFLSALLSAISAGPQPFWPSGAAPRDMKDLVESPVSEHDFLQAILDYNDGRSMSNERSMSTSTNLFRAAQFAALVGVVVLFASAVA